MYKIGAWIHSGGNVLEALRKANKPLILSETGFSSALGYQKDEEGLIMPISDNEKYGEVMAMLLDIIDKADKDYNYNIKAISFYEWRDNLYHAKITNIEGSPIHCAFGLCDRFGNLTLRKYWAEEVNTHNKKM